MKLDEKLLRKARSQFTMIGVQMLVVTAIIGYGSYYLLNSRGDTMQSQAGNPEQQITVSLYPKNTMTAESNLFTVTPVLLTNGKKVGFVKLTLAFDPAKLRLTEVNDSAADPTLRVLMAADQSKAETNGMVTVWYGAASVSDAPPVTAKLSGFVFRPITHDVSEIRVVDGKSSVTYLDGSRGEIIADNAGVNQPEITPTPTAGPTVTPSSGDSETEPTPIPTLIIREDVQLEIGGQAEPVPTATPTDTATTENTPATEAGFEPAIITPAETDNPQL